MADTSGHQDKRLRINEPHSPADATSPIDHPSIPLHTPHTEEAEEEHQQEQEVEDEQDDDGQGEDGAVDEDDVSNAALNAVVRIPCQIQAATAAGRFSPSACYRYTFIPRTQPTAASPAPPSASKFGGSPYLLPSDVDGDKSGALCSCGARMSFSFQLRADDLPQQLGLVFVPERLRGPNHVPMFQLWQCREGDHGGDPSGASGVSARWIDATSPSLISTAVNAALNGLNYGPEEALIGWKEPRVDHPNAMEQEEVWQLDDVNEDKEPIMGPKLSGFPCWIQDAVYPSCAVCEARMELFFEMYDDVFSTYICVCPTHREEFAVEAQCG
jgi:hypothetical protein